MPVSKKRKKDNKPVQRHTAPVIEGEAHANGPETPVNPLQQRMGKPSNPFVTGQQQRTRGAQRGR